MQVLWRLYGPVYGCFTAIKVQKFNFHNCRGLFKCWGYQMKRFSVLWKPCGGRTGLFQCSAGPKMQFWCDTRGCFYTCWEYQRKLYSPPLMSLEGRTGLFDVQKSPQIQIVQLYRSCNTHGQPPKCWEGQLKPFSLPWMSCGGLRSLFQWFEGLKIQFSQL